MKPRRKHARNRKHLRLAILTLVLSALMLTACKTKITAEIPDETPARELMVAMLPSPPEAPELPSLHWSYQDGLYGLDEEDVDKFLDFKENVLPGFVEDYKAWVEEVYVVLKNLI